MKLSAKDLLELEIIDEVIAEPVGGAHRDRDKILLSVRASLTQNLNAFQNMASEEIFNSRKNKYLRIGRSKGFIENLDNLSSLKVEENRFFYLIKERKKFLISIIAVAIITFSLFFFL